MRDQRLVLVGMAAVVAGSVVVGQVGRGGSQWLTALGDAQRTSWIRTDDKISVAAMSKPGFDLQWKVKLENEPRGTQGLAQGVTASGVTLFVPMSVVAGSSNNVYAIDNDLGYVVWQRHFDASLPAPTAECAGGITSAATRIVKLDPSTAAAPPLPNFGRSSAGYRTLLGEPGQGVPLEERAGGPGRAGAPAAGPPAGSGAAGAAGPSGRQGAGGAAAAPGASPAPGAAGAARGRPPAERIPGAPKVEEGSGFGFLSRPSGVGYLMSSDGMLHVLGLASGKDIQRPAPFLPANSKWSPPVAVDTMLYAATSGNCGGAPDAVWAIDLDNDAKPVASWKTNGGGVVGAVAFATDGTLIAALGAGRTTGEGKANAIVALDRKTLQLKDWFTQPTTEFATGPTILRHNNKEIVAAATKDGRVLLLDASSLGGPDHATPLYSSKTWLATGATVSADALATWQQSSAPPAPASAAAAPTARASSIARSWILLPVTGPLSTGTRATNGAISTGAVIALKIADTTGALSLEPSWVSHDLSTPATPIIVNGVVFTLASGLPTAATSRGTPAILHAYDGGTGKRLWTSEKAMSTFASPGSFWSSLGQIYVGTHDGTLYAFGFNDERRPTNSR